MGKIDEKEIFVRLGKSDKDALKEIFEAYYPSLCHYASHFLGDHDQSEEVVQDLFVRLWEKRERLEISLSLRSYLFRSVRNQCINLIMHEKVKQNHARKIRDAIIEDAAVEDYYLEEEISEAISSAISALPEKRREIFLLSRQEGLKYQEIAVRLNISVKTVEAQMGLALRFLREKCKRIFLFFIFFKNISSGIKGF
ncbi:RNA polymerase sigma-70 factor, Bacteroides expansion family 1 [Bacteroidales bacterium 6E]|nr:RNA polymerase sigma-70 factor, Bacteroides expansion family 1 [Bacteroidales bacterium 6E]